MSESFSLCEPVEDQFPDVLALDEELAEQAAAQGITFVAATGDSGAAGCDSAGSATESQGSGRGFAGLRRRSRQPSAARSLMKITITPCIGIRTLATALKYIPEDVWNETCAPGTCQAQQPAPPGDGRRRQRTVPQASVPGRRHWNSERRRSAMFLISHSVRRDTTGTSFVCKAPAPTQITFRSTWSQARRHQRPPLRASCRSSIRRPTRARAWQTWSSTTSQQERRLRTAMPRRLSPVLRRPPIAFSTT